MTKNYVRYISALKQCSDYLHWNVLIKYMKVIPKERGKFTDCCGIIDIVNCARYN